MNFVFFLLCFSGLAFMFFCLMRRLDVLSRSLREERAQTRALLSLIAKKLGSEDIVPEPYPLQTPEAGEKAVPKSELLEMKQPEKSAMPDIRM